MIVSLVYVLLVFLYTILLVFALYSIYAMKSAAPFVPSSKTNVAKMLALVHLQKDDTLMDLGSGDGRILFMAAPQVKQAIGIEINPTLYYWSRLRRKIKGLENVVIKREDLWHVSLTDVDVLTLFFILGKMEKLKEKIVREMKPGSRVVSNAFSFPDWEPVAVDGQVKYYIVPEKK